MDRWFIGFTMVEKSKSHGHARQIPFSNQVLWGDRIDASCLRQMFLALFRKYLGFWTQTAKHSEKALELIKVGSESGDGSVGWAAFSFWGKEWSMKHDRKHDGKPWYRQCWHFCQVLVHV